jgi:zinc transporter 9
MNLNCGAVGPRLSSGDTTNSSFPAFVSTNSNPPYPGIKGWKSTPVWRNHASPYATVIILLHLEHFSCNAETMQGLFTLLALSVVMAVASFLAGVLPLSLSLSQSKLRLISTIGMGVLVGTSLVVIIPEGVETLYSASDVAHSHAHVRRLEVARGENLQWLDNNAVLPLHSLPGRSSGEDANAFNVPGPVVPADLYPPPRTPTKPGTVGILDVDGDNEQEPGSGHGTAEESHTESQHAWIGVALLAGFMLMYLIDKVPEYTKPAKPRTRTHHIALNNLGRRFNLTTSLDPDEEADSFLDSTEGSQIRNRSFATTIGLVIHAAADGIALGASSTATNSGLSLVIFFAIMIHKAPAAFGLTSVLIKQGLSKRAARGHLVLFSLAAPCGAIVTWLLANLLGGGRTHSAQTTTWWTGMLLLFSAGTFLYVAMHSMQEASASHYEPANGQPNGYTDAREGMANQQPPSWKDLGAACFGMILPLFLQVGHAH